MYVLAFDRDWTVDVNPHPRREAVPLDWVEYWAEETPHEVWAIGNQKLVEEAGIPGTVESVRRRDGHTDALGARDERGYYEQWPERESRLRILRELFPDAEGHVVVDDLDLSHVDGWTHFHAWDFLDAVRDGRIGVAPPPSNDPTTDGGFRSADDVRATLDDGYVFELTYRDGGETGTYLVTHFEPERPSMKPLRGPPAFWFETVGNAERFSVRLPDIEAIHPVPYERLPDAFGDVAFAAVRAQVEADDGTVDDETIRTLLRDAASNPARVDRSEALRLATTVLKRRPEPRDAAIEATFELLNDSDGATALDRAALYAVSENAADDAAALERHVPALVEHVGDESICRAAAARCLMEMATADPASVLDAVPALETAATADDQSTRRFAVYTISTVADAYPEAVVPTIDALVEAMRGPDGNAQTNGLSALGKIASNYPDAAEPIADELVELLDDDAKSVRNNAAGLLADLAQEHPETVIEHAARIAARLDDHNIQARVNASIALLRAGETDPSAVRAQRAHLEDALDDASPEVRANACTLVGNASVPIPTEKLETMRETDPNDAVRERAAWALSRLD